MKFVGAIFEKIEFFFSSELLLILRVDRKQKYGLEIFARRDYIGLSNLNEIDQLVQALR